MKMPSSPPSLPNATHREDQKQTQNGTCGVLRKETLYALSFSVLQTKRSVGRSAETDWLPIILLLPTFGPAVL